MADKTTLVPAGIEGQIRSGTLGVLWVYAGTAVFDNGLVTADALHGDDDE